MSNFMEDIITYGVFWATEDNPDKFYSFSSYHTTYESAYSALEDCKQNPRCVKAKIVERVETFETVAEYERNIEK